MDFWEGSRSINRQKQEQGQGLRSGRGLGLGQEQRDMGVTGAGGEEQRQMRSERQTAVSGSEWDEERGECEQRGTCCALPMERLPLAAVWRISLRYTCGSRKVTKEAITVIQVQVRGYHSNSGER